MQFHKCNFILQEYDNVYKCFVDYTGSNDIQYLVRLMNIMCRRKKDSKFRIIEVLDSV